MRFGKTEIVAIVLCTVWLLGLASVFFLDSTTPADRLNNIQLQSATLAIFIPIAVIWIIMSTIRTNRLIHEESQRFRDAIASINKINITQQQEYGSEVNAFMLKKLDEISNAIHKIETQRDISHDFQFSEQRQQNTSVEETPAVFEDDQPTLALGTIAENSKPVLHNSDFIQALNFPENTEDKNGFASLRKAMQNRETAQLIQAAKDILTLLSQDGIYKDDLRPDNVRPEVWRQFASGSRGRSISSLGGVRDNTSLAVVAGRMKQDAIFRDAAHHFLRQFDRAISTFTITATDVDLSTLSNTRTVRAFMLLGRVAGTFD